MSKKIRFGVAGLGRIGWSTHCAMIANHPDCELVAVADTEAARRAEAEAKYGCKAFADFNDMIASGLLDAVVVATPTHLHEAMACSAFAQKLHVILEKPMAPTREAAERIAKAAKDADCVLTVYQPHRLMAYFQQIKSIVESGRIGKVFSIQRGAFSYARRNDWQSLKKFGGGMLNNYGAHFMDQMLQLVGYDIKRLFCSLQKVATLGDADDVVRIAMVAASGVTVDLQISQAASGKPYEFIVWGTCGTVELNGDEIKIRSFNPAELEAKSLNESLASADRKYPNDKLPIVENICKVDAKYGIDLYADFARAVNCGTKPFVPPEETIALMRILEKCRNDAGEEIDFTK